MANKNIHLCKYRKNKKLASSNLMAKDENTDWRTVIIYYSALHIIDSTYADKNVHPNSHNKRKLFMSRASQYKNILDQYDTLEMLSRKARYDALNIKPKELTDALICLHAIEEYFGVS